jgi:hypothetical protein
MPEEGSQPEVNASRSLLGHEPGETKRVLQTGRRGW